MVRVKCDTRGTMSSCFSRKAKRYSIALTKAAFSHAKYLELYKFGTFTRRGERVHRREEKLRRYRDANVSFVRGEREE